MSKLSLGLSASPTSSTTRPPRLDDIDDVRLDEVLASITRLRVFLATTLRDLVTEQQNGRR